MDDYGGQQVHLAWPQQTALSTAQHGALIHKIYIISYERSMSYERKYNTTSFYGSSCANNGKGALNTPASRDPYERREIRGLPPGWRGGSSHISVSGGGSEPPRG
eukprot:849907-Prorocentrum_minimum.AAC.2